MRLSKSKLVIIKVILVCSILFCANVLAADSNTQEGQQDAGIIQIIMMVFCITGALGVIVLGWQLFRLAGAITSIAGILNIEQTDFSIFSLMKVKNVNALQEFINKRISDCDNITSGYDKQIGELNIQLQLSQKRVSHIEEIIYSIQDAVIVIDEYDKLLMANESAGELLNFEYKNSRYKPIRELIDNDQKEFLNILSHTRKSKGRAVKKEIEIIDDCISRTFDCIVSCVHDQNKQVIGVVAVLHDITKEKEISQMKNDFISHVSHELKTPLASITAYSEMLADGEAQDEETRLEFCSVIQNQAQRLNRMIEDILNTSRIESGLIKINKENVSLTILIEEQLQAIKGYAEEKNIKIIGQTPIVFDQVNVDKDMMSQVIINLLSNAIKYTKSGGSVSVRTELDENESLVRVSVTDTGVGIPEEEIGMVFEKYYRVGANNKHAKGTGLGLNLVKQIVEKIHSGKVFVKSRVGEGSTFGFELPLATKKTAAVV